MCGCVHLSLCKLESIDINITIKNIATFLLVCDDVFLFSTDKLVSSANILFKEGFLDWIVVVLAVLNVVVVIVVVGGVLMFWFGTAKAVLKWNRGTLWASKTSGGFCCQGPLGCWDIGDLLVFDAEAQRCPFFLIWEGQVCQFFWFVFILNDSFQIVNTQIQDNSSKDRVDSRHSDTGGFKQSAHCNFITHVADWPMVRDIQNLGAGNAQLTIQAMIHAELGDDSETCQRWCHTLHGCWIQVIFPSLNFYRIKRNMCPRWFLKSFRPLVKHVYTAHLRKWQSVWHFCCLSCETSNLKRDVEPSCCFDMFWFPRLSSKQWFWVFRFWGVDFDLSIGGCSMQHPRCAWGHRQHPGWQRGVPSSVVAQNWAEYFFSAGKWCFFLSWHKR